MQDFETPSSDHLDQTFAGGGLQFQYPGYWQIEEHQTEDEFSVTILTEGTSFWMVSLIRETEDVDEVLESAVGAFEEEYDELDVYERQEDALPGWIRQELELDYQDLISTVVLQAVSQPGCVLLVLYQGHDNELEEHRRLFDAITTSLSLAVQ